MAEKKYLNQITVLLPQTEKEQPFFYAPLIKLGIYSQLK